MTEIEEARAEIARLLVERDEARAERDRRIRQKYETDAALRDIEESLRSSLTAAESKLAEVGAVCERGWNGERDLADIRASLNSEGREMGKGEENS
jgi:septal ring factor EnvC (AmiA/AmiB activator)